MNTFVALNSTPNAATPAQRRTFGDTMVQLRPGDHTKLAKYIESKSFGFESMGSVLGSMFSQGSSDEELRSVFESIDEDKSKPLCPRSLE